MRYVLMPGYIQSRNDGQAHYINAEKLSALYGVKLQECFVYDRYNPEHRFWRAEKGDILLRPRWDGDYQLPKKKGPSHAK